MAKEKITNFSLSAVYGGKNGQINFNLNHDVIHNTNGSETDLAFCSDLASKLANSVVFKNELTEIDGERTNEGLILYGWNDLILTQILDIIYYQTYNIGYTETTIDMSLNPAGVTVTFEFTG